MQAPGFIALGAGVGHFSARAVEVENLDARLGGGKHAVILVRTGHLTLQTAGALLGIDVQTFEHAWVSSRVLAYFEYALCWTFHKTLPQQTPTCKRGGNPGPSPR